MSTTIPKVVTIAGSDSGGGAGIQADLKTFTALNVFGMSVITALTAQNTIGVQGVHFVPIDFVESQFNSIATDIGIDVVKTGILGNKEVVSKVSQLLKQHGVKKVVVDPVMISTSGSRLLEPDALEELKTNLLPLATIVTPNIAEASVLIGSELSRDIIELKKACLLISQQTKCKTVLIKGGYELSQEQLQHHKDEILNNSLTVTDVLFDDGNFFEFSLPYIHTKNTHGTGCTLASAIATFLGKGLSVVDSVREAQYFVNGAIRNSLSLGSGHGPLNHSFLITPIEYQHRLFDHLRADCKDDWEPYVYHKFVKLIGDGTLDMDCFLFYLRQDYIFLKQFARANAISMYKCDNINKMKEYAKAIGEVIIVETDLHAKFCEKFGISREELDNTRESTFNMAYTRFVLETGMSGDELDLRVAMIACIAGYGEIGLRISLDKENNPFREWVATYSSDWFQKAVKEAVEQLDDLVRERGSSKIRYEKLKNIFRQATRLEIKFWEMGLNKLF